jgi:hypothetical protein
MIHIERVAGKPTSKRTGREERHSDCQAGMETEPLPVPATLTRETTMMRYFSSQA